MTVFQDLAYAARLLRKSPGYTLTAAVTLALGIGATTAVFSVVDALLWKPLPLPYLDRLSAVVQRNPSDPNDWSSASPPDLEDVKTRAASFEAFSWWTDGLANIVTTSGEPERADQILVSAGFFETVGARPTMGRTFVPDEDQPGRDTVVILSDALWRRAFGADRAVIGKHIRLDDKNYEVVGVMPRGFVFPAPAQLWTPLGLTEQQRQNRAGAILIGVGRRRAGVTSAQAAAEVDTLSRRLEAEYPATNAQRRLRALPLRDYAAGTPVRQYMLMLLCAVVFVLLIACVNVANLQLARAAGRRREVAVRCALGAGRARVIRQLLTESVLLAGCGGVLGLLVAGWGIDLIRAGMPPEVGKYVCNWQLISLDFRALAFAAAAVVASGLISGIAPALHASPVNLNPMLREGGRGTSSGRSHRRWRSLLVAAEVSLAVVLLVGAGLMVRGFGSVLDRSAGRAPDTLLTLRLALTETKYREPWQIAAFYGGIADRLAMLPGVRSAAVATAPPYSRHSKGRPLVIEGHTPQLGEHPSCQLQTVSPSYFATVRVPLRQGRLFDPSDDAGAPRVAVVSERLAARYWPGDRSVIGRRIRIGSDPAWVTIVGVVSDIQYSFHERGFRRVLYLPAAQAPELWQDVVIRTAGDPHRVVSDAIAAIRAVDPEQPVTGIETMTEALYHEAIGLTYVAVMMAVFGGLALVLSCVGVYGVVAYTVSEQTHEIGVRIALGARAADVMSIVFRRGMFATAAGAALGLTLAFGLARVLSSLVFGVSASDPATFTGIPLALAIAALAANWIPARRAVCIDPIVALRYE